MRFVPPIVVLCFLGLGVVGCGRPAAPSTTSRNATTGATPPAVSDSTPTREEVLNYLDGKEIQLTENGRPADTNAKPHVLKKEQIEALQIGPGGFSVSGGPWNTDVNFIVNTGEARYAVIGRVEHKRIDDKRGFFGLQVEKVAKQ